MRRLHGFTLIEIAVVLFIGALVIGGVVQYLALQVATAKITGTKAKQDAIKSALVNYIARNNQLPCPADPTLPNGDPLNGVAKAAGVCTGGGVVTTAVVAQGMVPWSTLGMSSDSSLDGYGNRFTYQVVIGATNLQANPTAGQQTVSGMRGAITIHSAGPAVIPPTAGANQTNNCTPGTPTNNPCLAVAVAVSHGLDGFGAYTDAGVQIAFPATVTGNDARENANADSAFVVKTFSSNDINPFDDIVMVLAPNDLLGALTSGGSMQDARALVNASFSIIKSALIANSTRSGSFVCVNGNCGNSTNCLVVGSTCELATYTYILPVAIPTLPDKVKTDPWGNAILYVINILASPAGLGATGTISPNPGTSPLDITAFTLKSMGPNALDDACAAGTDDICTTVSVSEFQTLAAKFR